MLILIKTCRIFPSDMRYYPHVILATFAFTAVFFSQFEGCTTAPIQSVTVKNLQGWNDNWTPAIMAGFTGNSLASVCPKWEQVDKPSVWLKFWENIIQHESSMNPNSTYTETSMGIDPITGKQVVSAGLLQLSFQDVPNYKGDCMAMSYGDNPRAIF